MNIAFMNIQQDKTKTLKVRVLLTTRKTCSEDYMIKLDAYRSGLDYVLYNTLSTKDYLAPKYLIITSNDQYIMNTLRDIVKKTSKYQSIISIGEYELNFCKSTYE